MLVIFSPFQYSWKPGIIDVGEVGLGEGFCAYVEPQGCLFFLWQRQHKIGAWGYRERGKDGGEILYYHIHIVSY